MADEGAPDGEPPSYRRRDTPARPWMNIGKNTPLMKMNDAKKCTFPQN